MRKILSLMIVALFIISCANNDEGLKIGIAPNYKPFDYKQDGKLTGFDVDLVEMIAKKEGIKITWQELSFDGLIPALKTSKINMIASAMSKTEERAKNVDFSDTYYLTKNLYIKHKDNTKLKNKDDLTNLKIGVQLGTLQEVAAKNIKNADVQTNEDLNIAILALKNKKIDAVVADKDVARGYLKENAELEVFFEENDGSSGLSFAFEKDKHKEIILKFNRTLQEFKQDGSYEKLLEKYDLK
ncbi:MULTISPECIES: transporter substrate-binding domain-containing protein [unclassified Campylobacter]|uniref:transporter substrate-binding domain-containing protein n=1 Tax=unclassified Campylobacter TaxID=2593542 RepID=UPI0012382F63|nr:MULTISPECIES: transporter substrate-binding domain-containing protein [unclassified Campylobacter]KAA6225263.1 transporter substrate-binding domain-containing protein [Campylobacter sp. LR185c]KAA6227679.1 transporter substrate-binding domain-containing protein [Campylobacter sp. LR286c]KAA6227767.1 transporter substrate-binding domain-containing protein [Campylobacter sp. LR196d]KAA6229973.1 transporter substrate-binding domain-containing protein [Campylobacter sp. LR264d]KAA6233609.1 tran